MAETDETYFQKDVVNTLQANGWRVGVPGNYDKKGALYTEDALAFVKETQPRHWKKYVKLHGEKAEEKFLKSLVDHLSKKLTMGTDSQMRRYGTLGVLRHGFKDTGCEFKLCQFEPEHDMNEEATERYEKNIFRVVPEVVYSPYSTDEYLKATGEQTKKFRIDLVLFVNGIPVSTMELKSEFKQAVQNAIKQYKTTRLPKDPVTKKPEPLLTFKRGAVVHFAVSQYEVHMCTKLDGSKSYFLPFNKGTKDGGKGNDIPENDEEYATAYLWDEVFLPKNLLKILQSFVHLDIEEEEDARGVKTKKEKMIFPRYHQWKVVRKLTKAVAEEGVGNRYLIQHSAGSGKSNSIAWTAHQLASMFDENKEKMFHSVIIVTDRTVLDNQLQETISQFTDTEGVVCRINNKEGQGSKSEKLASALENDQPIIIVTIQTFKFVLDWIEKNQELKAKRFAVIADEAHSSQGGSTAKQMKSVLKGESSVTESLERDDEDELNDFAETASTSVSFFAFTATPKDKTIQLFGRCPKPDEAPSKENLPVPFDVYTMRQAIEEGFILDVLKNYTTYNQAYRLAMKSEEVDKEVDTKKASKELKVFVKLHGYNVMQHAKVIVEHYRQNIMNKLHGQAKAMVVTSSRKEAVKYMDAISRYVKQQGYADIKAMVAFSGEVKFNDQDLVGDEETALFAGDGYTESNLNPALKGRDMRDAFDTDDFQLMLVANKFQTGFDQPKLCAMYVLKKLSGIECVQTLSRLNRCAPGKAEAGTFVLDFVNDPAVIRESFLTYFKTAELEDVSDPNVVYELEDKLRGESIFTRAEVERFWEAFHSKSVKNAKLSNICKPAVERWQGRYQEAREAYKLKKDIVNRAKKSGDTVLITNAENDLSESKKRMDDLLVFKKDLGSFTRYYEFMSQIVPYDSLELEQLSVYARQLQPMLREEVERVEDIDLHGVDLSHYRLSKQREQDISLVAEEGEEFKLKPGDEIGSGVGRDREEELLSTLLNRLNEVLDTEGLTDNDLLSSVYALAGKVSENESVMKQIENNDYSQVMLGDFPSAFSDATMENLDAQNNVMMQILSSKITEEGVMKLVYQLLKEGKMPIVDVALNKDPSEVLEVE